MQLACLWNGSTGLFYLTADSFLTVVRVLLMSSTILAAADLPEKSRKMSQHREMQCIYILTWSINKRMSWYIKN